MSDEERIIREQLERQNAVLVALFAGLAAQEERRKTMHRARQKPRGGYRNKK